MLHFRYDKDLLRRRTPLRRSFYFPRQKRKARANDGVC